MLERKKVKWRHVCCTRQDDSMSIRACDKSSPLERFFLPFSVTCGVNISSRFSPSNCQSVRFKWNHSFECDVMISSHRDHHLIYLLLLLGDTQFKTLFFFHVLNIFNGTQNYELCCGTRNSFYKSNISVIAKISAYFWVAFKACDKMFGIHIQLFFIRLFVKPGRNWSFTRNAIFATVLIHISWAAFARIVNAMCKCMHSTHISSKYIYI